MIAAFRDVAIPLLLIFAQPLFAHGDESHGEAPADAAIVSASSTDSPNSPKARAAEVEPVRPAVEHDADTGSIWTRLHPPTVHFPIALLPGAALAEFVSIFHPSMRLTNPASVIAWGGAGAVVAALFRGDTYGTLVCR